MGTIQTKHDLKLPFYKIRGGEVAVACIILHARVLRYCRTDTYSTKFYLPPPLVLGGSGRNRPTERVPR